jgi:hypothetical protein
MQVEADSVGHDLSFGWSHFNRGVQAPRNAAQALADGEMSRQAGSYDPEAGDGGPDGGLGSGLGGGEPGAGGYDPYVPASLPRGEGHGEGRGDSGDEDEPPETGDVTDEMMRGLAEPTEFVPAF